MTRKVSSRHLRPRPLLAAALASAALAGISLIAAPGSVLAASGGPAPHIRPVGELDCNGHSPVQRPVKPGGTICAEVHLATDGGRF